MPRKRIDPEAVRRLAAKKWTDARIASELGFSESAVFMARKRHAIAPGRSRDEWITLLRQRQIAAGKDKQRAASKRIVLLASQGLSDVEIAHELKLCTQTVAKWRRAAGVQSNRVNASLRVKAIRRQEKASSFGLPNWLLPRQVAALVALTGRILSTKQLRAALGVTTTYNSGVLGHVQRRGPGGAFRRVEGMIELLEAGLVFRMGNGGRNGLRYMLTAKAYELLSNAPQGETEREKQASEVREPRAAEAKPTEARRAGRAPGKRAGHAR
jgi:DNA-binding CsgD family transcriptional regulator